MKKIISAILTLALSLAVLASCGVGPSVPYYILAMDNYTVNVFDEYDAYRETVTYYKNGEKDFEYSIYVDIGEGGAYNVCESYEGYTFYGYGENLYAVTGGKTYAVLQTNNRTYFDFIGDYAERAHPLDDGAKFQKNSKKTEAGTEVEYYVKVTPLMAAELAGFGVTETDKIVSEYRLMENTDYYLGIEYRIERADGTTEKIAERKFEYFDEVQKNIFENVPEAGETVSVKVIYENGKESAYKLPKGVYIGFDGEENVTYYADESFETIFDFENTPALESIKIYAKNN
ncbi:MAG: hypothetical protein IJX27_05095 [Clostridia bacterium]|nr:hypothetical protein [Clostridia bacterium]